jgi:hypothetical protein
MMDTSIYTIHFFIQPEGTGKIGRWEERSLLFINNRTIKPPLLFLQNNISCLY